MAKKGSGVAGDLGDNAKGEKAGDGYALNAKQGIKQEHTNGSEMAGKTGKGGLARLLEPEKNEDEFGKGTVGAPDELHALREDGNQGTLGDTTLLYGGGYFEREEAGLEDGIALRETMDPDKTEPNYNYDIDPLTGSAPERKVGRANNYEVKGKRNNTFEIGEM